MRRTRDLMGGTGMPTRGRHGGASLGHGTRATTCRPYTTCHPFTTCHPSLPCPDWNGDGTDAQEASD